MAKDINSNKPRGAQKKDDDSAVLKIMIALLLLVFSVFMLRLVANNYGTIVGADRILCMQAGRIVESGTHAELLRRGGVYADIYKAQYERGE